MNLVDFPIELQVGFLLEMTPDELLSYCLTSKEAYQVCSSHEFLHQYVFRKYHLDLDRIPGDTPWDSFQYLNFLLEESDRDYSEEISYYNPWDSPETPKFEVSSDLEQLVYQVVGLNYPELLNLVMENVIASFYAEHDIGDLDLIEAYQTAQEIGNSELINTLLAYYIPHDEIHYLQDHPNEIEVAAESLPELAWILLDEEIPMPKETEEFLRRLLPQTRRYNRPEPIPFLEGIVHTAQTYDSGTIHNIGVAREYNEKIGKIKKLIRPDIAAKY